VTHTGTAAHPDTSATTRGCSRATETARLWSHVGSNHAWPTLNRAPLRRSHCHSPAPKCSGQGRRPANSAACSGTAKAPCTRLQRLPARHETCRGVRPFHVHPAQAAPPPQNRHIAMAHIVAEPSHIGASDWRGWMYDEARPLMAPSRPHVAAWRENFPAPTTARGRLTDLLLRSTPSRPHDRTWPLDEELLLPPRPHVAA
jgi:hypothetical protein